MYERIDGFSDMEIEEMRTVLDKIEEDNEDAKEFVAACEKFVGGDKDMMVRLMDAADFVYLD